MRLTYNLLNIILIPVNFLLHSESKIIQSKRMMLLISDFDSDILSSVLYNDFIVVKCIIVVNRVKMCNILKFLFFIEISVVIIII